MYVLLQWVCHIQWLSLVWHSRGRRRQTTVSKEGTTMPKEAGTSRWEYQIWINRIIACRFGNVVLAYHGLFVNSPVVIIVTSCWMFFILFNTLKYYVCLNHCHGLWRTAVTWFALALKTCLETCLSHVNLRQITLLKGYISPFAHSGRWISDLRCI